MKMKPNKYVKIVTLQIAFTYDNEDANDDIYSYIYKVMMDTGINNPNSLVVDWETTSAMNDCPVVQLSPFPKIGEVFRKQ